MASRSSPPEDLSWFVEHHYRRLLGALILHCGSEDVAAELAQETLLRVCERWESVRGVRDPVAWMFRTAFNLSASRFRRLQAERRALTRRGLEPTVHVDRDVAEVLTVRAAVRGLPARQRSVVILRFLLAYTPEEAAAALGLSNGAVRSATHRAMVALRRDLDAGSPAVLEQGAIDAS